MPASLTFLTPSAGLLALAAVVPLTALAIAGARVRRARALLRLPPPHGRGRLWHVLALALVPLLIALALAQPAWRRHGGVAARADAAVFVVVDTSNSMAAAASARSPSRLEQAKSIALAVGSQLPGIPLGVATFTDRTLPDAFPSADQAIFDSTIRALTIESPPPRESQPVATNFSALAAIARGNFFTRAQRHRVVLLITDGESEPFDASAVASALAAAPPTGVVIVRVGGKGDRLHRSDGTAGGSYRADPAGARRAVDQLAAATHGSAFSGGGGGVAAAIRSRLGSGETTKLPSPPRNLALGPVVALASLVPLLLILTSTEDTLRLRMRLRRNFR
ncbi:MAG: von Willebrand factor type domain [bacterium]